MHIVHETLSNLEMGHLDVEHGVDATNEQDDETDSEPFEKLCVLNKQDHTDLTDVDPNAAATAPEASEHDMATNTIARHVLSGVSYPPILHRLGNEGPGLKDF